MKKSIFLLAFGAMFASANAQDFKPVQGSKNLEFQFAPLGGSPIGIDGLRYRQFLSPTTAIRANVSLDLSNKSTITQDANKDLGAIELKDREFTFDLNLRPGFEKHFTGTDRLSPYIGAELDFNFRTTSQTIEDQIDTDKKEETKITNEDGSMRLGLNGVAGFDYYFAKHLYFGAELGFGFSSTMPFKTKTEIPGEPTEESSEGKSSTFNFGPNVVTAIRLGYLF
jgi:hypothetical protein